MSVESEILRIQHNIANTYASVAAKSGQVPLQPTSENLAAAVSSIPQTLPPPDNNPVGTVISYTGIAAPKDYLICDGSEYDIAGYPELANHFQEQLGSSNYFGGDGETTFAVPDMRNLFLRGYHGEAGEQLSGDIGARQEATQHYNTRVDNTAVSILYRHDNFPENADSVQNNSVSRYGTETVLLGPDNIAVYTSRPVNMAVLYCIKAAESAPKENVYSTEETRIGTWINGKPLYRRGFPFSITTSSPVTAVTFEGLQLSDIDELVAQYGSCSDSGNTKFAVGSYFIEFYIIGNELRMAQHNSTASRYTYSGYVIFEYTKTTD